MLLAALMGYQLNPPTALIVNSARSELTQKRLIKMNSEIHTFLEALAIVKYVAISSINIRMI
jgi:hypothetical protein